MLMETIPAVLRVGLIFALILFFIRKRLSLGNAFLLGACLLGFLFGMNLGGVLRSFWTAVTSAQALSLAVVVSLILVLSHCMEKTGRMARMLDHFKGIFSHSRINLIIFPSLIGLLPMPGGAVFSAPMVKVLGHRLGLTGSQLSFVNYWFRHIWEYWWPMYPGFLLIIVMAELHIGRFIIYMLPISICAAALGYLKLYRDITDDQCVPTTVRKSALPFLYDLLPISIVIVLGLGFGWIISTLMPDFPVGKESGLVAALIIAVGWVMFQDRVPVKMVAHIVVGPEMLKMIYMIFAIFVFKGILEDSHAVMIISSELLAVNVPLILVTMLLPFLVGVVTGITVAFVGATLPIILPLISAMDQGHLMPAYMMLLLCSGFTGVLLSPLHLCLILSNQYFNAEVKKVYRQLWAPCGILILVSILYFFLLSGLLSS
jgi:uncharacterized protein